jgi:hypothetical protein
LGFEGALVLFGGRACGSKEAPSAVTVWQSFSSVIPH